MTPTPLPPVDHVPIGQVRPSADNPRKIPQSAIDIVAKSIAEFGWQQPLVVDRDGTLIAGHTRHLAAKQLKLDTVPVVVADHLTPDQVRAYRIADNRSNDFTSWDFTALTVQLDDLADDFSDVLALANWQAIVAEYDAQVAAAAEPTAAPVTVTPGAPTRPASDENAVAPDPLTVPDASASRPDAAAQTPPATDPIASYLAKDFAFTVVCDSEYTARVVAAAVIDMPGVTDVRDKL